MVASAMRAGARRARRWLILFVGLIAMTAGCTFQYGLAYLIPALRHEGFSLELAEDRWWPARRPGCC